jgi:excisionase family DNA binding protein
MVEHYISTADVMEMFEVESPNTVYLWRKKEGLPFYKIGRLVKFKEEEVIEWAKNRRIEIKKR